MSSFSIRRRWRISALIAVVMIYGLYSLMRTTEEWHPEEAYVRPADDGDGPFRVKPLWGKELEQFPVESWKKLPRGSPVSLPKIQVKSVKESSSGKKERLRRLAAVKESFIHSWEGYKANAWLRDEVIPIAGGFRDTFGGWAATLVDGLDTMWIMGLKEEFEMAVDAVEQIDFTTTEAKDINVFETTIRYLGGFLAAYDISEHKYPTLLLKAVEVAELLMGCFDTPNRMPITRWRWKSYAAGEPQEAPPSVLVSEIGTLSLEFTRLSQLTGENKYYDAVQRLADMFDVSQNSTSLPGMWPVVINGAKASFSEDSQYTLGGMSDSAYEYLPKQFMLLGGLLEQPRRLYETFIEVAKKHMFFKALNPDNLDIAFSGDLRVFAESKPKLDPRGQHLTCFVGGMVAIASKIFNRPSELELAEKLTDGCVWAYDAQVTGIAPEIFSVIPCNITEPCIWSESAWFKAIDYLPPQSPQEKINEYITDHKLVPGFTRIDDRKYILRPEAIESVFIMYRITGDIEWQHKAWRMFQAIDKACRTDIAYSAIFDVTSPEASKSDSMESFWLAETLKYFYLIFHDIDVVSLDDYVLNTEAHPLRRPR